MIKLKSTIPLQVGVVVAPINNTNKILIVDEKVKENIYIFNFHKSDEIENINETTFIVLMRPLGTDVELETEVKLTKI